FEIFARNRERDFMTCQHGAFSYAWLLESIREWDREFERDGVKPGTVVALLGDYSPRIVGALLALVDRSAIVVPLSPAVAAMQSAFLEIAEVQYLVSLDEPSAGQTRWVGAQPKNGLTLELIRRGRPGLVLFSSGSTGKSKAALHDFAALLEKFKKTRRGMVTLAFLMIDHIGGVNTLFHVLSNGGAAVVTQSRDPNVVCETIAKHRVELLPT